MDNMVKDKENILKVKDVDTIKKISGESLDIVKENVQKLKEIFPEVFCEDKIDFKRLEEVLGEYTDDSDERYRFEWHGKSNAIKIAQTPSRGTLRPCKEESKNWDTTENLYIEGDNLEVLKLLQKSYQGKIKMIYIDPPYNTGNDFIYQDDYSDNLENYLRITGQKDEEGNKTSTNSESSGRHHTNWLNMMYPRLRLARNLLSDDGAIFISIDGNELDNLKVICDEIFGPNNFRNQLITRRRVKSLNLQFAKNGLKSFNIGFEYVLVYSKSQDFLFEPIRIKKIDASGKGTWNVFWSNADRPTMRYDILGFTPTTGQWRWQKELADEAVNNYKVYMEQYSSRMTLEEYYKYSGEKLKFIRRIKDGYGKNGGVQYWIPPSDTSLRTSNWTDLEVSQIAKDYDIPFDNPKNVNLIKTLISSIQGNEFIILDFFSGSATTADAIFRFNKEDGGMSKFIMVQLPEECDKKSEAYKRGYGNICEIGKERIRRAGDKIVEENKDMNGNEDLDTGFKVFKLDTSNIKPWNPDYDNIEMTLEDSINNFVPGRTQEDIVYEIMLKYGIDLTYPVDVKEINNRRIFSVGCGALLVCLDDDITLEEVNEIVKLKDELKPETCRVVFKDNGFKTDSIKTNAVEILKKNNIKEIMSI